MYLENLASGNEKLGIQDKEDCVKNANLARIIKKPDVGLIK
jgi:hypothetical protein